MSVISPLANHSHHLSLSSGYLEEEVKKVNIKLAPGGNVLAPDPQDMIDLEVMIFIVLVGVATPSPLSHYSQSLRYWRQR